MTYRDFRSEPAEIKQNSERFSPLDVGLTNELNNSFLRLAENGDIHIFADQGVGIVLNPRDRSITFVADSIKFITKKDSGLRWNEKAFNPEADSYAAPTFMQSLTDNLYSDVLHYIESQDNGT